MSLVKWGFIGLLALPAAEFVVFVLVALAIGWWRAIALFLITSLIGVMVLKHAGRSERDRFRAALASRRAAAIEFESPSLAAMIGGILLVFPGFITDLAGALLLLPGVRRWLGLAIARRFAKAQAQAQTQGRGPAPSQGVVDLEPDQWHQVPDAAIDHRRPPQRPP